MGPVLPFSDQLHATKYRGRNESFREAMNRVASSLSDGTDHFHAFREILQSMRFLPGGRVQAAMGSPRAVTAYNCFVSGTINDSYIGPGSIMDRASEAAATMRMGGGIGYDFSTLRPRGSLIKTLESLSCGPVGFLPIYDAVCLATASSGHRRGAQMGVLRIDHPDIVEFINTKHIPGKLAGFNLSIAVTDEFMTAKANGTSFPLQWSGQTFGIIDPNALWEMVMRSTWDYAEPGVLFIDRINQMNNLWYCETITATNPCGEQPLPPYGACLLGSFNLPKYIFRQNGYWSFNTPQLKADIPHVVRAMDNVINRSSYPLQQQKEEAMAKRRMGLGVTGLANAVEALGFPYGSEDFLRVEADLLTILRDEAYRASIQLAVEKGAFPLFHHSYEGGQFIQTLPDDIQVDIRYHGIRNSHLLSIAPTGTISLCADNVSSSIEPVFDYSFRRTIQTFFGPTTEVVEDYGRRIFGVEGKRARDVTPREHIDVLLTAQILVDSACSKTCNVSHTTSWEEFKEIYNWAYINGAKGVTTFTEGGKREGIFCAIDEDGNNRCE